MTLKSADIFRIIDKAFPCIDRERQLVFPKGILFSKREIMVRNADVLGRDVVIGALWNYDALVVDEITGRVGVGKIVSEPGAGGDRVTWGDEPCSILDNLGSQFSPPSMHATAEGAGYRFVSDARSLFDRLSSCGLGKTKRASLRFKKFLHDRGVPETFCYYRQMPVSEVAAGACTLFPSEEMILMNDDVRHAINPDFIVIGTCPDCGFVVLDLFFEQPRVGYVAFCEIGDEGSWRPHYVEVAETFERFLHDSNFLWTMPVDYYQAKEFGW